MENDVYKVADAEVLDWDDFMCCYYWHPYNKSMVSMFDTLEKAVNEAQDFVHEIEGNREVQ